MLLRRSSHVYLGRKPPTRLPIIVAASVQVAAANISVNTVDRKDTTASVQGAQPDITYSIEVNPVAMSIDISVQGAQPTVTIGEQVGRKTIRGTAGNSQQLYDETNQAHNTVLFNWAWYDAIGIANLTDANLHSTGQVTTDAAGNWSIDLDDTAIAIGSNGTLLIQGDADLTLKRWAELPVEFV